MFLYNITYKVDKAIAAEWVQWQKENNIPAIVNTGHFYDHYFFELPEQEDSESKTFAIQFVSKTRKDYDEYIHQHASLFRNNATYKWANRFVAFRTIMESV